MADWVPGAPALEEDGAPFGSPWDRALAASGPPTVFTLDPRGELRADAERTRECVLLVGQPDERLPGHFVLTDRMTGLRLYLYVTHVAFATCQPRGTVVAYPTARLAIEETMKQWAVSAPEPVDAPEDER